MFKVTQLDGDRARAQSSLFQVTCAFWDQIVGTCWSLGRAVLALCCYRPHHRWGPSRKAQGLCQACQCCSDPYSLSCNSLLPLCYHQPTTWPWELPFWGIRGSERRKGVGSFDRCCFQFLGNSSPFYFPNFSIGSANCRNFSPSGWQPRQVAAWGGLATMRAETQRDSGSCFQLPSSLHMVMIPPSLTPFPKANTQVLLFRKKTGQLWPAMRFLLFCPNYCISSYAETGFSWLLLRSEP